MENLERMAKSDRPSCPPNLLSVCLFLSLPHSFLLVSTSWWISISIKGYKELFLARLTGGASAFRSVVIHQDCSLVQVDCTTLQLTPPPTKDSEYLPFLVEQFMVILQGLFLSCESFWLEAVQNCILLLEDQSALLITNQILVKRNFHSRSSVFVSASLKVHDFFSGDSKCWDSYCKDKIHP